MSVAGRRVTLVALNQLLTIYESIAIPFSYATWKLHASLLHPTPVPDVDVHVYEAATLDANEIAEHIIAQRPDVVGFSAYLWSFSLFVEATRIIRQRLPHCTVLFGGPSGRPAMFDLPEFRDARALVDGICVIEGEALMRAVVEATDRSHATLRTIPGLVVPENGGWFAVPRVPLQPLDTLPSPYQLGLVAPQIGANLETFRGCPLSCSFCEWGALNTTGRIFSADYLVRELEALRNSQATSVYLIDAGLNLNRKAFRNLVDAERQVRVLRTIPVGLEIYATAVNDADVEFLLEIMVGRIGIGLQSFNPEVNKKLQRPYDEARFMRGLAMLAPVPNTAIELIFGLPFDSPASFRETVRRALELNAAAIHIFHSLVLPDGLMTRAPAGSDLKFDAHTLKTISAHGWSEHDLRETMDWLDRETETRGGTSDSLMWRIPGGGTNREYPTAVPSPDQVIGKRGHDRRVGESFARNVPGSDMGLPPGEMYVTRSDVNSHGGSTPAASTGPVALESQHALGEAVQTASVGTWKLVDAHHAGHDTVLADCTFRGGAFQFELRRAPAGSECFRWVDGVAVSHTTPRSVLTEPDLPVVDRIARALGAASQPLFTQSQSPSHEEPVRVVRLPSASDHPAG